MKKLLFILLFAPLSIFGQNPAFAISQDTALFAVDSVAFRAKKYIISPSGEIIENDFRKPKPKLTLEDVKAIIAFPKESGIYYSLAALCDVWFLIEKGKGATDEAAIEVTIEKLGKKLLSFSRE